MGVYTTFFLCAPNELLAGFFGWKEPLCQPVRREFRNPFTGEMTFVESDAPDWLDAEETAELTYQAISIEGNYDDYLQSRLPPFVRQKFHWAAKGLTTVEVEPLLETLGVKEGVKAALYAPPSSGNIVEALPSDFLPTLRACDLKSIAARWAAALSTREHTHSVSGVKLSDGWTLNEALAVLTPLLELGSKASPNDRLYLLTEV